QSLQELFGHAAIVAQPHGHPSGTNDIAAAAVFGTAQPKISSAVTGAANMLVCPLEGRPDAKVAPSRQTEHGTASPADPCLPVETDHPSSCAQHGVRLSDLTARSAA